METVTGATLVSVVAQQVGVLLNGAATGRMKYRVEAVGNTFMPHTDDIDLHIRITPILAEEDN